MFCLENGRAQKIIHISYCLVPSLTVLGPGYTQEVWPFVTLYPSHRCSCGTGEAVRVALVTFYFVPSLSQLGPSGHLPPTCPFCPTKPPGQALGQRPPAIAHHRCLQGPTSPRLSLTAQPLAYFLFPPWWRILTHTYGIVPPLISLVTLPWSLNSVHCSPC